MDVNPSARASAWTLPLIRSGAQRHVALTNFLLRLAIVFLAYLIAGKLGQATTSIRSGNLGPVWPASGIALAMVLAYGHRVWPALFVSSFLVAFQSPVLAVTALGQAAGATLTAVAGAFLVRRVPHFDPALPRLRDALTLIVIGGFASTILSSSIGSAFLNATQPQSYSGMASSWLIYWLGDATGVLLVTPLVFTLPVLVRIRSRRRLVELAALLTLLVAACLLVFADLPLVATRLHVLAFVVVPFVMWAAIGFGVAGASLAVFVVASLATVLTALGSGPFSAHTPFVNAVLLDVFYTVLAVSGLALAAVITERERAEADREALIRGQAAMETRLGLAAIVESSNEAIVSTTLDGTILSWNAAAQRIFGFTEAEAVGQPSAMLVPSSLQDAHRDLLRRARGGTRIEPYETILLTKTRRALDVSVTMSPVRDTDGRVVGVAKILRDITEERRAADALSSVSRRLLEAQEQERSRIARELHDDIGQRLALLAANLADRSAEPTGARPPGDGHAAAVQQQVSEIAAGIQALSHRLHSSRLELLGLAAAARQFCEEFAEQQKASVDFESGGLPERLPPDVSLCLFRILQEALHNAAKHSGTRRFAVRLSKRDQHLHLLVSDRGSGFNVAAARRGRGIGLVSMEERIKLVDGELTIDSGPHQGTTVHARVPQRQSTAEWAEQTR